MDARPLTDQQHRVLEFASRFVREHGFPPTLREIGEAIGLANVNAVRGHLVALEKKGYITKAPEKARSIQIVRPPSALSRVKRGLHKVMGTDEGVLHRVVYGLAWTTRGRVPWLTGQASRRMHEATDAEAIEHGWTILDRRVEPNHVVLVVETWPNHSPQLTVRRLQAAGVAARRRHPNDFPRGVLWERGYAATTEPDLLDDLVARLLQNGEEKADRWSQSSPAGTTE